MEAWTEIPLVGVLIILFSVYAFVCDYYYFFYSYNGI